MYGSDDNTLAHQVDVDNARLRKRVAELEAQMDRIRALVPEAYREGWYQARLEWHSDPPIHTTPQSAWACSEVKAALEKE